MTKFKDYCSYLWKEYWLHIAMWVIVLAAIYWGIWCFMTPSSWENVHSYALTTFGILGPVALGLIIIGKEWKDRLEKRLIVHFTYKNCGEKRYIASGYNVTIPLNSGLRELGQQIGAQIFSSRNINFDPSVEEIDQGIKIVKDEQGRRKSIYFYELEFILTQQQSEEKVKKMINSDCYHILFCCKQEQVNLISSNKFSPYHEQDVLSFNQLLNDDEETLSKALNKHKGPDQKVQKVYFLNSSVITGEGTFKYQLIDESKAKKIIEGKEQHWAIRQEGTARWLSEMLEIELKASGSTEMISMEIGEQAIVLRLKNRPEKLSEIPYEKLDKDNWELGLLERIA